MILKGLIILMLVTQKTTSTKGETKYIVPFPFFEKGVGIFSLEGELVLYLSEVKKLIQIYKDGEMVLWNLDSIRVYKVNTEVILNNGTVLKGTLYSGYEAFVPGRITIHTPFINIFNFKHESGLDILVPFNFLKEIKFEPDGTAILINNKGISYRGRIYLPRKVETIFLESDIGWYQIPLSQIKQIIFK